MLEKKDFFLEDLKHDSTLVGGWHEKVRENSLLFYVHTERSAKITIQETVFASRHACVFVVVGLRSHTKD